MAVATQTYSRSHTATFVSDRMRQVLKLLVRRHGLNPEGVVDAWSKWVDRAVRTWLESGHLRAIKIEFFRPGSKLAVDRWDFLIRYDGQDHGEMWLDRGFLEESFAKTKAPPAGCTYRIVLETAPNEPNVDGVGPTTLRELKRLTSREAGTVIATNDLMVSARYHL